MKFNTKADSRRNGVAMHAGAGSTEAVRKALEREPRQSIDALHRETGYSTGTVIHALRQLVNNGGAVCESIQGGGKRYSLYRDRTQVERPAPKTSGDFAIAGPKLIRGYLW